MWCSRDEGDVARNTVFYTLFIGGFQLLAVIAACCRLITCAAVSLPNVVAQRRALDVSAYVFVCLSTR